MLQKSSFSANHVRCSRSPKSTLFYYSTTVDQTFFMSQEVSRISPPSLKRRRLSVQSATSQVEVPVIQDEDSDVDFMLRLYFWNINGITPLLSSDTPSITNYFTSTSREVNKNRPPIIKSPIRACLRQWQWPHLIGLQEVKIAASDSQTQTAFRRSVNTPLEDEINDDVAKPLYDVHFSLPRDKHNATGFGGKVYGVCLLVKQGNFVSKIKRPEWDLEGRLIICEIPYLHLLVINVYAVNGTDYDYHDPETGKVICTRHTFKREFHTRLADEVRNYETNGWHVVVGGDINISRTGQDSFPTLRMGEKHVRNRTDFEKKFMVEMGMLDTFRLTHGEERKYTYRPTNKNWGAGGDRVDMILTTKELEGKIVEADILDTEADRGPSDHVPHFVGLNLPSYESHLTDTEASSRQSQEFAPSI